MPPLPIRSSSRPAGDGRTVDGQPAAADGSAAGADLSASSEATGREHPAQAGTAASRPVDAESSTEASGEPSDPGRSRRRRRVIGFSAVVIVLGIAGLGYEIWRNATWVDLENEMISAPQVTVPARAGGTLKAVYASLGDQVQANRPIARVGNEVITSDVSGTVVTIRDDLGAVIAPGTAVAGLIDRGDLRAVGTVDEDKGLEDLHIGQRAEVEVDAFSGRSFTGFVEDISARPQQQAVTFSISDKDDPREYEITVRLDGEPDPDLRQGMSGDISVRK